MVQKFLLISPAFKIYRILRNKVVALIKPSAVFQNQLLMVCTKICTIEGNC